MTKLQKYLSILLGVIYVLSGFGKAIDIKLFSDLIESYGNPRLAFLAPLIEVVQKNGTLFCIKNAENGSTEN